MNGVVGDGIECFGPIEAYDLQYLVVAFEFFQDASDDVDWLRGGAVGAEPVLGFSKALLHGRAQSVVKEHGI